MDDTDEKENKNDAVRIEYEIDNMKHVFSTKCLKSIEITDEINNDFKVLKLILKQWILFAEENNFEWWAIGGTLLGAFRHGGFIPWDDDIDICIRYDIYDDVINKLKKFKSVNFKLSAIGIKLFLPGTHLPFLDIFVCDIDPEKNKSLKYCTPIVCGVKTWCTSNIDFKNESFHLEDLYPLKEILFENIRIKIPNNSVKFLKQSYSDDCLVKCIKNTDPSHKDVKNMIKYNNIVTLLSNIKIDNLDGVANKITSNNEFNKVVSFFKRVFE